MSAGDLIVEAEGDVGTVRFNRPHRSNAFTDEMLEALAQAVVRFNDNQQIKVVVLGAIGGDFCAGRDLDQLPDFTLRTVPSRTGQLTNALADLEMPVVGALRGAVVGGGMGLALMCDVVVAGESTYFIDGHLRAGMTPSNATWWLPRTVGYHEAMDILLTGRRVPVGEARKLGIVNRVVADTDVESVVADVCTAMCRSSRDVLVRTKRAVRFALESDFRHSTEQVGYLRSLPRSGVKQ
jgi:enoyl-CoA hydratase/carnithine racemase